MIHVRRKKLVRPGLQLRLVASFLGVALLGVLLQFLLIHRELVAAASQIPGAGGELADRVPAIMVRTLSITLLVLVPLLLVIGVLRTFRIAGPLYRFDRFLRDVAAGRQVDSCRLRKGDELHDLCELLNEVTEPLRRQADGGERASGRQQPAREDREAVAATAD